VRAEADRLAYVAATRARDLLVVTALGTMEWTEGWLSPLFESLYPVPGFPIRAYETGTALLWFSDMRLLARERTAH
jgi:hypothetical protein